MLCVHGTHGCPAAAGVISSVGVHTERAWGFSPGEGYDKNVTYTNGRCPARAFMSRLLQFVQARPNLTLPLSLVCTVVKSNPV